MDRRTLIGASLALAAGRSGAQHELGSPSPRPRPSASQLRWQREEVAVFVHFTVNTFTDREWGDGTESPDVFAPAALDARAWARAAADAGARAMILTAKHHDGFCLWPTRTTTHSVRSSSWRGGGGDVVREFADACRAERLGVGIYLSPWDRHEPSYGDIPRYNDLYIAQLRELLTLYGPIGEVWFDGANGEGPNGRRQTYDWPRIHRTVRALQPGAVIFSDAGPDVRWIGNEKGVAGETCWSTIDPAAVPYPGYDAPGVSELLQRGDPDGSVWRPGETDVSIRPGWFWHPSEDERVRPLEDLVDLYCTSVGRNSKLLLNVPPTREGVFHPTDTARLAEFGARIREIFATDHANGARVTASSTGRGAAARVLDGDPDSSWSPDGTRGSITLELARPARIGVAVLEEAVRHGQAVERYRLEMRTGDGWKTVARGTTIGYRKIDRFPPVAALGARLTIDSAVAMPRIARLGLFSG